MTDNRTTELIPCPICGKKVSIARTENEQGERWWFITRGTYNTTRCNCRLFLESEKFTCDWNDDYALECRAKLIATWNTRTAKPCYATDRTHKNCKHSVNRGWTEEGSSYVPRLNGGTLTAEQVRDIYERHEHDMAADYGMSEQHDSVFITDWQAIADELNATYPIVRCRDCRHRHLVRNWLGMDVDECWLHADRESGALGKVCTELNGFCAWGERKVDE